MVCVRACVCLCVYVCVCVCMCVGGEGVCVVVLLLFAGCDTGMVVRVITVLTAVMVVLVG